MKIISLTSVFTLSIGILVLITYQQCYGLTANLPGGFFDSDEKIDNSDNCPCIPRDACPRLYGQSAVDIREFGFLQPCLEFGTVRCCGVTIRIVQNGDEDESFHSHENEKVKYDSIANLEQEDLEIGESTVNSKIVLPPTTRLSNLMRTHGRRGQQSVSPQSNTSVVTPSPIEHDDNTGTLRTNTTLVFPSNINSNNNISASSMPTRPSNSNFGIEGEIRDSLRLGPRILTESTASSQYRAKRPTILPGKGLPKEKSTTSKPKLPQNLKLPFSSLHSPTGGGGEVVGSNSKKSSTIELPDNASFVGSGVMSLGTPKEIDGKMNVTEINVRRNSSSNPGRMKHPINSYTSLPTIRPFVVKKRTNLPPHDRLSQQQASNGGTSENAEASMQLKTKIEPTGGLRQHFLNRQTYLRNRTAEQVNTYKVTTTNIDPPPPPSSTSSYQLRPPMRRLKRPYGKLGQDSVQIVETPSIISSPSLIIDSTNTSTEKVIKMEENNEDVEQEMTENFSTPMAPTNLYSQSSDNQPSAILSQRRRIKSRVRISTTPGPNSILETSTVLSTTLTDNNNNNFEKNEYSSGNDDKIIQPAGPPTTTVIIPSPSLPTNTQIISKPITEQVPLELISTTQAVVPRTDPTKSHMMVMTSIGESHVMNSNGENFFNKTPSPETFSYSTSHSSGEMGGGVDSTLSILPPYHSQKTPNSERGRPGSVKVFKNTQSRPRPPAGLNEGGVRLTPPVRTISQYSRIRTTKTNGDSKKGDLREQSDLMSSNSSQSYGTSGSRRFTIPSHLFNSGSGQGSGGNGNENFGDDKERHSPNIQTILRVRGRDPQRQQFEGDSYDLILDKEKRKFMQIPQHHQNPRLNIHSSTVHSSTNPDMKVNSGDSMEMEKSPFYHTFSKIESSNNRENIPDIRQESRIHQTFIRGDRTNNSPSTPTTTRGIGSYSNNAQLSSTRTVISRPTPTPSSYTEPLRKRLRQRVKSPTFTSTPPTTTTISESQNEYYEAETTKLHTNYEDDVITVIQFNSTHHHLDNSPDSRPSYSTTTTLKPAFVFPAFKQDTKTTTTSPSVSFSSDYTGDSLNSGGKNTYNTETHFTDKNPGVSPTSGWVVSTPMIGNVPSHPSSSQQHNQNYDEGFMKRLPPPPFPPPSHGSFEGQNNHGGDRQTVGGGSAQPSRVRFPERENNKEESGSLNRVQPPFSHPDGGYSREKSNVVVFQSPPVSTTTSSGSASGTSQPEQTMKQVLNLDQSRFSPPRGNLEKVNVGSDNSKPLAAVVRPKPARGNNTRFTVPKTFNQFEPSKSEDNPNKSQHVPNETFLRGTETNARLTPQQQHKGQEQVLTVSRPTSTGNRLVGVGGGRENVPVKESSKGNQQGHDNQETDNLRFNFNKEIHAGGTPTSGGFSFYMETPQQPENQINYLQPSKVQQHETIPLQESHSVRDHSSYLSTPPQIQGGVANSQNYEDNHPFLFDNEHFNSMKSPFSSNFENPPPPNPPPPPKVTQIQSMTHNAIPSTPSRPLQSESQSHGTPGFSISFSTLPEGIKLHETHPNQFGVPPPPILPPSASPPYVRPSQTLNYYQPQTPAPPPYMAHIRESDFIPQHDPTLPTAPPSSSYSQLIPSYSQQPPTQSQYHQQGQQQNGYSQPIAQSSNTQPNRWTNGPKGSNSIKQSTPTRYQSQIGLNSSPRPIESTQNLASSKPTHYSRPTNTHQQQSHNPNPYKPQVDFHGGRERESLGPYSQPPRQVYQQQQHQQQQHMSIPENIVNQLKSSMRNSRATNLSDIPPPIETNLLDKENLSQVNQMVDKIVPMETNNSLNIHSLRSGHLWDSDHGDESQINNNNATQQQENTDDVEIKLEANSQQNMDTHRSVQLPQIKETGPQSQDIYSDQDGHLPPNPNPAIAALMDSESERKSRVIGFTDPVVIQGGFIPILPYSEQDPGPIFVKMERDDMYAHVQPPQISRRKLNVDTT